MLFNATRKALLGIEPSIPCYEHGVCQHFRTFLTLAANNGESKGELWESNPRAAAKPI